MCKLHKQLATINFLNLLQTDISRETISDLKRHLLTALQNLKRSKQEKQLIVDLWCHFGKVLFCGVDEGICTNVTSD